ncbi:MAG: DUF4435 domain-containing protein [Chloroflexi bacterium]|nr:DUF4435 domain-containing protein [Chloroflexota bacterium]
MLLDIPILIAKGSDHDSLSGNNPIVIVGPNGSGKTRHAINMAAWNDASHIGAVRNIELPTDVGMMSGERARIQLSATLTNRRSRWWQISNEIDQLFGKLLADNSEAAVKYRDGHYAGSDPELETTNLMKLQDSWKSMFPGRSIEFRGNQPFVVSKNGPEAAEYSDQQMSDGERVGLYLAGRVLDASSSVIIVDEPEVHFHSRLAARFWTELESLRSDCRFVYLTHDLPFALSRRDATFIVVMPNSQPQVVELKDGLPSDLIEALLGAASFSIHARRIVFCEGQEGKSIDQALYSAWFSDDDTAVVPVGSSSQVTACVDAFRQSKLVAGVEAIGIIDRDYWPDKYLESLPEGMFVLPVHEVENLYCIEEVFKAVATYLGKDHDLTNKLLADFKRDAIGKFSDGLFAKQVSQRFKMAIEHYKNVALNKVTVDPDRNTNKLNHLAALIPEN